MLNIQCDVAVIGAGPAGLSAAIAAKKEGAQRVFVIERDKTPGGILQQCIHAGFGLKVFHEELTGPEYAHRFIREALECGVEFLFGCMALQVGAHEIICLQEGTGVVTVKAGAVVLAMGARERTRAALRIPGTRPAGIYTAGAAQRLINRQNMLVGKNVVILGSGDIGMIMARRLTLEGAKVLAVVEIMDYLAGLTRNRVQCLDDFDIPLYLSHTVTFIEGNERVTGVVISEVDEKRQPIPGTEQKIPCDTLLLSVGLIPENELTAEAGIALSPVTRGPEVNQYMQTSIPPVFAAGNVLHINDLVDNVSLESAVAGRSAARYALGKLTEPERVVQMKAGEGVRYLCPQTVAVREGENEPVSLFFRVVKPDRDVRIRVLDGSRLIFEEHRKRVSPGEMEQLRIRPELIPKETLTVEIRKEAE